MNEYINTAPRSFCDNCNAVYAVWVPAWFFGRQNRNAVYAAWGGEKK